MVNKAIYSFALTNDTVELLDRFQRIFNLRSRSAALELLIHEVMEDENIYEEYNNTEAEDNG